MTFNPWTEASRVVQDAIIKDTLSLEAGLSYMNWVPAGDPGTEKVQQKRVKKLAGMDISVLFHQPNPQKLSFEGRDLYTMWMGMDVIIGWEEMHQLAKFGGLVAGMDRMLESGLIDAAKTVWQGTTETANGVAITGLNAAGSGTFADPSILDAGATAGDWEDAGAAAKDINKLHSTLRKYTGGPLGVFVPRSAMELVDYPIPTAAATFADRDILDLLRQKFDVVIFTGDDPATGYNLITGAAETAQDCQIFAADLDKLKIPYQKDMVLEDLGYDKKTREGTIRYDGKFGFFAEPVETSSGTYQKMVCEIDSIDLSD